MQLEERRKVVNVMTKDSRIAHEGWFLFLELVAQLITLTVLQNKASDA
jgi:hypothetical protein